MSKVTIDKKEYEALKRDAKAWRSATGDNDGSVIFNATRDNGGKGVPVEVFIDALEKLEQEDKT
jgi:hypothetical protein